MDKISSAAAWWDTHYEVILLLGQGKAGLNHLDLPF